MYLRAILGAATLAGVAAAQRGGTNPCPDACSASDDPFNWMTYHSTSRVAACDEPMLLDFAIFNPLNGSQTHSTIYACTTDSSTNSTLSRRSEGGGNVTRLSVDLEFGAWGLASKPADSQLSGALADIETYMVAGHQKNSLFGLSGNTAVGIYIGGRLDSSTTATNIIQEMLDQVSTHGVLEQMAMQYCGSTANYVAGVAVNTNGDLSAVQELVKTWTNGDCVSGFGSRTTVPTTLITVSTSDKDDGTVAARSLSGTLQSRADSCSTVQVVSGDSCATLVTECGITSTEFYEYNTASDLCSTLAVGQYVCCSSGDLPDLSPKAYSNGTCYTYLVESGDSCSSIAAAYSLSLDDIESYNNHTWGWLGCDDLQAGENICLSSGDPPFPAPVTGTTCGPQVPGTTANGTDYSEWATLNPCTLNACCDVWGQCGTTPEFCTITESTTGNPGTAEANTNGCISNCGTDIINNSTAPDEFFSIGYFEAFNVERTCLKMNAYMIDTSKYTHVIYAFGTINADYSITINETTQFEQFLNLTNVKKIVSFGGWTFSTDTDTYTIFREGVTANNRATLAKSISDFVSQYDLDGVDFDWEYPGEPDIPGIPAGNSDDGTNYVAFLKEVRSAIGTSKTLSIAMPASYWYLKGFPVSKINSVVDFVVFMTYDLHGQWDYGNTSSDDGCEDGNCLRSHVNLTETGYALSMVTKAGMDTNKLMVGVASYGRSFEMTTANCTGPDCTYVGPDSGATPGRCTQTAGYISNAEINGIIASNPTVEVLFDAGSDSDIIVYNETQWGLNMGGTTEWAIDLEEFVTDPTDLDAFESYFLEKDSKINTVFSGNGTCDLPSSDETAAQASEERGVAAYIDWLLEETSTSSYEWANTMFYSSGVTTSCDVYPDGPCDYPTDCTSYSSTPEFWAEWVVANFFEYVVEFGALFDFATFNQSNAVGSIATDFPVKSGATVPSVSTVFTNVGGVLGILGSTIPLLDAETDTASSVIGTLSGLFSTAGGDISDSDSTAQESQELLTQVSTVFTAMVSAAMTILEEIFQNGNISSWPADLREGDYNSEVANFFDGRYMFKLTGTQTTAIETTFNARLQEYLVGSALVSANYYILKGAYSTGDCASVTSGTVIGDYCYTLQYPGAGWELTKQIMTETISSSDLTKLTDTYGVDLTTLYDNAYTCQNTTGTYAGTVELDVLEATSSLPTCFFNLPVFTVETSSEPKINNYLSSPCLVYHYNTTEDTPELGVTWMPANLADIFVKDFCQCSASERECTEI